MVFFNIKKLENQLATGQVTSKDEFNYLIGWVVIISLVSAVNPASPYSSDYFDLIDFVITLLISIVTLRYVFKIHNQQISSFLTSLISLAFVIFWRILAYLIVFSLLGKIILYIIPLDYFLLIDGLLKKDFTTLFYTIVLDLTANFLLIRSFKRINDSTVALEFK